MFGIGKYFKMSFFFFHLYFPSFPLDSFFYQFIDESHIKPLISSIYFMCFFYILGQTQRVSEWERSKLSLHDSIVPPNKTRKLHCTNAKRRSNCMWNQQQKEKKVEIYSEKGNVYWFEYAGSDSITKPKLKAVFKI